MCVYNAKTTEYQNFVNMSMYKTMFMQIATLLHFTETFLTTALIPDDSMELPERYNLCQHFENVRSCTQSTLGNVDPMDRRVRCVSSDLVG